MGSLQVGQMAGEYEIVRPLGEGGMGEVYEAVHPHIGKSVAIKVMRAAASDALTEASRLLEEARAVNAIRHRGIVDIFGANVLPDGRAYLVMQLLEGETVAARCARAAPLPLPEVFEILEGALEPLAAAHRGGIIHRDLKPSNLFLENDGEGRRVKLLDFGVARRASRAAVLTQPEMTVGSFGFMSPEQLGGQPVPQSDLYSLGCVAWVLLTGQVLFHGSSPHEQLSHHLVTVPPSVDTLRADVSRELAYWVAWLLQKAAGARPFTAEVALAALRDAASMTLGEATINAEVDYVALVKNLDASARASARSRVLRDDDRETPTVRIQALSRDNALDRTNVDDSSESAAHTRPSRRK